MTTSAFESLSGDVDLDFPAYDDPPPEPLGLVRDWIAAAEARGVREPKALALATADSSGRASNRIVAITAVDDAGLVFLTHSSSRKGREMAATGWASGLLYWRETGQQLVLSGPVQRLDVSASDALWQARPVPLHAMSVASRQSEPLDSTAGLRREAARLAAVGGPLPRPERFSGYRLTPAVVEFWCASSDRLHRRLRYDRGERGWQAGRLQP
jgi:dihydrophenazinedicarboxylate synthase